MVPARWCPGMVAGFFLALAITWFLGGFGSLAPAKDELIWTDPGRSSLLLLVIALADDLFACLPCPGWPVRWRWRWWSGAKGCASAGIVFPLGLVGLCQGRPWCLARWA